MARSDREIEKLIRKTQKQVDAQKRGKLGNQTESRNDMLPPAFNCGYLFYRRGLPDRFGGNILHPNPEDFKVEEAEIFTLTTVYPGLFIGSGYPSPVNPNEKDTEFKLGFFFDHTTGFPIIPGSTVKGVLRSLFRENLTKGESKESRESRCEWLRNHLGTDHPEDRVNWLYEWGMRLFTTSPRGRRIVYHDAYISRVQHDTIFAEDFITPHVDGDGKFDPFKEPNPLRFLIIAPEVEFTFQFDFNRSDLDNDQRGKLLDLFKQILRDFGIGARRNLGYGSFS